MITRIVSLLLSVCLVVTGIPGYTHAQTFLAPPHAVSLKLFSQSLSVKQANILQAFSACLESIEKENIISQLTFAQIRKTFREMNLSEHIPSEDEIQEELRVLKVTYPRYFGNILIEDLAVVIVYDEEQNLPDMYRHIIVLMGELFNIIVSPETDEAHPLSADSQIPVLDLSPDQREMIETLCWLLTEENQAAGIAGKIEVTKLIQLAGKKYKNMGDLNEEEVYDLIGAAMEKFPDISKDEFDFDDEGDMFCYQAGSAPDAIAKRRKIAYRLQGLLLSIRERKILRAFLAFVQSKSDAAVFVVIADLCSDEDHPVDTEDNRTKREIFTVINKVAEFCPEFFITGGPDLYEWPPAKNKVKRDRLITVLEHLTYGVPDIDKGFDSPGAQSAYSITIPLILSVFVFRLGVNENPESPVFILFVIGSILFYYAYKGISYVLKQMGIKKHKIFYVLLMMLGILFGTQQIQGDLLSATNQTGDVQMIQKADDSGYPDMEDPVKIPFAGSHNAGLVQVSY
ncbi:MAG: hypothetical protein ABII23_01340 [bacterium]